MNKKQRNWALGLQGHVVNYFSRPPLRFLFFPPLPFGLFAVVLEDNPCCLSECPMFNHQCHYLLTTQWNGKQGSLVLSCVDPHMRPPAEMKALATCDWRQNCEYDCVCCMNLEELLGPVKKSNKGITEFRDPHKYFNTKLCVCLSVLGCVCTSVLCDKLILHVSLLDLSLHTYKWMSYVLDFHVRAQILDKVDLKAADDLSSGFNLNHHRTK